MKTTTKSILSSLFAFLLFLCIASPSFSVSAETVNVGFSEAGLSDYIQDALPSYLRAAGLTGDFSVSQGIPISNDADPYNHICFVFSGQSNIGYFTVTYLNGTYHSSYVEDNFPIVDSAYCSSTAVAITVVNNNCYILSANQASQFYGQATEITFEAAAATNPQYRNLLVSSISIPEITTYGSSIIIDPMVPLVGNATSPDDNRGLCWCACASSIGAYKTNTTPRIALYTYTWVKNHVAYESLGYSNPVGDIFFTRVALNNQFNLNYSCIQGGLDFFDTLSYIANDSPIQITIKDPYHYDNGQHVMHDVVICGLIVSGEEYYYWLMDPNITSHVLMRVGNPNSTNIAYTSGIYTYTVWVRSFIE